MQASPNKLSPSERKQIFEFLKAHPVGVLATTNPDGTPQASAIYFGVDEELHVTFTTKRETHKYENILKNDAVMLVVYDAAKQTSVQIGGQAVEVTDSETQHAIYYDTLKAAKQSGKDVVPPIAKINAGPYVGFTLKVHNIWLSDYGWGDTFARALKHIQDPRTGGDPA